MHTTHSHTCVHMTHAHPSTYIHTLASKCKHTHIQTHVCTLYPCPHTHAPNHTCAHAHLQTRTHTLMHTGAHSRMYPHQLTHTHTHAHAYNCYTVPGPHPAVSLPHPACRPAHQQALTPRRVDGGTPFTPGPRAPVGTLSLQGQPGSCSPPGD